ncbi:MAG TPA: DNA mismatch repair protein MutS [Stellaceae bacterium]|nr:DNA mismatch repair protein MutS [Stellaceae bacterium]
MKARLLYPNRDFDWRPPLAAAAVREAARTGRRLPRQATDRPVELPWNAATLTADLSLDTLFEAMAGGDDCIFEVARAVIFGALTSDLDTIRHRQAVLQECLDHPRVVRELYAVAVEAMEKERRHYFGSYLARHPDSLLRYAVELMADLVASLKRLRKIADAHAQRFGSAQWTGFFTALQADLDDSCFAEAGHHLRQLRFRDGVLLSAGLGSGNRGAGYVLRGFPQRRGSWREWFGDILDALRRRLPQRGDAAPRWLRPEDSPVYSFSLHPRDEAGARALVELRNRGIARVTDALAQSAEHVRDFFGMLQAELAFYVGCLNLRDQLAKQRQPISMPLPAAAEERRLAFRGLADICLALELDRPVVGNDADADGKDLIIVTGANTGGKSTFLRSLGLAQLLMQAGMFVAADEFRAGLCRGIFTHYKREEDAGMQSGKLDEEMRRMSEIVDHLAAHSLILFNESFAATNEREGSEIARTIMTALVEKRVRIGCVTHLYELAHGFHAGNEGNVLFLRAERARTFKLRQGEPLPTSFGDDLYRDIFGGDAGAAPDDRRLREAAS